MGKSRILIYAMRADRVPPALIAKVPGTVSCYVCSVCGHNVLTAPSTQQLLNRDDVELVCDQCLDVQKMRKVKVLGMTSGAESELEMLLKKDKM